MVRLSEALLSMLCIEKHTCCCVLSSQLLLDVSYTCNHCKAALLVHAIIVTHITVVLNSILPSTSHFSACDIKCSLCQTVFHLQHESPAQHVLLEVFAFYLLVF